MNHSEQQMPNPNQPQKPNKKKKNNPILNSLLYLVIVLLVSVILASAIIVLSNDLFALTKPDQEVHVTIPEQATTGEVAAILHDNGVIDHKYFFSMFVTLSTRHVKYNPGEYDLNQSMDYREVLNNIRISPNSTITITIPEGYTIEQIKKTILDAGLSNEKELTEALKQGDFSGEYLPEDLGNEENRLEGYLFPDTYEFYVNTKKPANALDKMLSNFNSKLDDELLAAAEARGYDLQEIVTIASLIEKETDGTDQGKIASVIYNRLEGPGDKGGTYGLLQIDAALLYALPDHEGAITNEDKTVDSPYNLYKYAGLPPTPIANPGLAAIEAALEPESTDYYYYALGKDGRHHYSKTLNEHNAFVNSSEYGG